MSRIDELRELTEGAIDKAVEKVANKRGDNREIIKALLSKDCLGVDPKGIVGHKTREGYLDRQAQKAWELGGRGEVPTEPTSKK